MRRSGLGFMVALLWGLCLSGWATIDLSEGANNMVVETIARNAVEEPMLQISVDNKSAFTARVTTVTLTASGTADDVAHLADKGVQLYWDKNGDGRVTLGSNPDVLLTSGAFTADNGRLTLDIDPIPTFTIPPAGKVNLLVLYTLAPDVPAGRTFQVSVADNGDITVVRADTGDPIAPIQGAPVTGFPRAVGSGVLTVSRLPQSPDGSVAVPNRSLVPMINLRLQANDVERILITSLDIEEIGGAHAVTGIKEGGVKLFQQSAAPTGTSNMVASGHFIADNGRLTLVPETPLITPRNGETRLWVTFDLAPYPEAVLGSEYRIRFPVENPAVAVGGVSGLTPSLIGAGANGPVWECNRNPLVFALSSDLGSVLMPPGVSGFPAISFSMRNDPVARNESISLERFRFRHRWSAEDYIDPVESIQQVYLYMDASPRGRLNATDELLTSGVFVVDSEAGDAYVDLDFSHAFKSLSPNQIAYFLVTFDLAEEMEDGKLSRVYLTDSDDIAIIGQTSGINGAMTPRPFQGAIKTVGQPRAELRIDTDEKRVPPVIAPEASAFPILSFTLRNLNDEEMVFQGIDLRVEWPEGMDINDWFYRFQLWTDDNGDSIQNNNDRPFGADTRVSLEDQRLTILVDTEAQGYEDYVVPLNTTRRFTVYADVATTVSGDGAETFALIGEKQSDVVAVGRTSRAQYRYTTGQPPFTAQRTIRNPVVNLTHYPGPKDVYGHINGTYGMGGVTFPAPKSEDIIITRGQFRVEGSLEDPDYTIGGGLWVDRNKDLYYNQTDFGYNWIFDPLEQDNGTAAFDLHTTFALTRNQNWNVSYFLSFEATTATLAHAQLGKTVTLFLDSPDSLGGYGAISGRPIEVLNPSGEGEGQTMTFATGDLNVRLRPIKREMAPPNGTDIEVMCLQMRTSVLESVWLDELTLTPMGSIDESQHLRPFNSLKLYVDYNRNGVLDANELAIGPIAVADRPDTNNGAVTFREFASPLYTYPSVGLPYDQLILTVDLGILAPEGATLQFSLREFDDLQATGTGSLWPYRVGEEIFYPEGDPALDGPEVTIVRGKIIINPDTRFVTDNTPEIVMAPAAQNYEVMRLKARSKDAESVSLVGLTIHTTGTIPVDQAIAPSGVLLYLGTISASNLLTSGTFNVDEGSVFLTDFAKPVIMTQDRDIELRVALTGTGNPEAMGHSLHFYFAGEDLMAFGESSFLPVSIIEPNDPVRNLPIRFGPGRLTIRATDADQYVLRIFSGQETIFQPLNFAANRTEPIQLRELRVRAAGTADEIDTLENGALLMNRRSGSQVTRMSSAPILPAANGQAWLRNLDINIDADKNTARLYSLDGMLISSNTLVGSTYRFDLETTTTVVAIGALTGEPVEVVFQDFTGGDSTPDAPFIDGRLTTMSTGLVTLKKNKGPAAAPLFGDEQKVPLLSLEANVHSALEGVTLSHMRFELTGTFHEQTAISAIYLYNDINNDGVFSDGDVLLSTGAFGGPNRQVVFSDISLTYGAGAKAYLLVAADLTGEALPSETVRLQTIGADTLEGMGQLTKEPIVVAPTTAIQGPLFTRESPVIGFTDSAPPAGDRIIDFGNIYTAGDYFHELTITNLSPSQTLQVEAIALVDPVSNEPSEDFHLPNLPEMPKSVDPLGSFKIQVQYTPTRRGPAFKDILVTSNDGNSPEARVQLRAVLYDQEGPRITHSPVVDHDVSSRTMTVACQATDLSGVQSVRLHYRKRQGGAFAIAEMTRQTGSDRYVALVPEELITLDGLEYYIHAQDALNNNSKSGTEQTPHRVIVYSQKAQADVPAGASAVSLPDVDLDLDFQSSATTRTLSVYRLDARAPQQAPATMARHWLFRGMAAQTFNAGLTFHYRSEDLGTLDEDSLVVMRAPESGGAFEPLATTRDRDAKTLAVADVTEFSLWAIGGEADQATPSPTPTPTGLPDTDGDGKPDECEFEAPGGPATGQTSLFLPDSDGDGLLDGQEDPGDCEGVTGVLAMTNPRNPDTDGDGILDGVEVLILGTDPLDPDDPVDATDSSGDGLPDAYVTTLGGDPNEPDWDGDGFTNGYELLMGSDPLDDDSIPALGDVDGDGQTNNVDAVRLFNFFLGNTATPTRMDNADVRADGQINNVDAVVLFNWILGTVPFIPLY